MLVHLHHRGITQLQNILREFPEYEDGLKVVGRSPTFFAVFQTWLFGAWHQATLEEVRQNLHTAKNLRRRKGFALRVQLQGIVGVDPTEAVRTVNELANHDFPTSYTLSDEWFMGQNHRVSAWFVGAVLSGLNMKRIKKICPALTTRQKAILAMYVRIRGVDHVELARSGRNTKVRAYDRGSFLLPDDFGKTVF